MIHSVPGNYRGITLLNIIYKKFLLALRNRINTVNGVKKIVNLMMHSLIFGIVEVLHTESTYYTLSSKILYL